MKTVILIIILGLLLVVAAYMYISRNEVADNRKPARTPDRPVQGPVAPDTSGATGERRDEEPPVRPDSSWPDPEPVPEPVPEPDPAPVPFVPKEETPVMDSSAMNRTFWSEIRNLPNLGDKKKADLLSEMLKAGLINRDQYAVLFSMKPEGTAQQDISTEAAQEKPVTAAPVPAPAPEPVSGFDSDDWGTF